MIHTYAEWIIRWRWWIVTGTLVAVLAAASGIQFVGFSNDYRVFFSEKNPQLEAFEALQNIYTKTDNVLFVISPKDGQVFTRDTLASVEWLTQQAWKLPYSTRVDSITNFPHTYANGDDLVVENLIENATVFTDEDLVRVRDIAVQEPMLVNRLISPRAHVTGVNTTIVVPEKSPNEVPDVVAHARRLAQELQTQNPNLEVHLTGGVLMNNAFGENARKDIETLTPIMYGVIILVTYLALRSFTGTLATILVILFSLVTAVGLTGWIGIRFTPPSATAPTIILTLAVADSIHILVTLFQAMRRGIDKKAALIESLRVNMGPIFFTSLTDVIGFLTMNFSEVPPFRDLGNITTIGVILAFLYSVLFLPALILILPVRIKPAAANSTMIMQRFGDLVVSKRKPLLWGMSLIILVLMAFIPQNELNDQYVKYFDERVEFRRATDFTVENLTGMYQVHYSIGAGESSGISNPEYLKKLEEFSVWFRQQPGVIHVGSLTDIIKRLNKNLHGDDPAWYRIPEEQDLAAQYLLLYELSLPFGLDLNDQINVDKSATRLTVTMENLTTKQVLALEAAAQQWLRDHAPPSMLAQGASPAIMFSYIGDRNIRSMLKGNILALLLISGVMILILRSFKMGMISVLPNLVPIGMAFGLWGMFVGQVGLSLSVVATMTLGIVVDDTIHFLSKYLHARRKLGYTSEDSVRYAFSTVGTALLTTTLILMAGFSVLAVSAFELNSGMGMLTTITFGLALLADFLMLAPLLIKLEERRSARGFVAGQKLEMKGETQ
ncbi:MAG: MMPL family transporter [Nitrospira sp.]|nr:MMPL family transporter [Nitrospira sp.]